MERDHVRIFPELSSLTSNRAAGVQPASKESFNRLLLAVAKHGTKEQFLSIWEEARRYSIYPNRQIYRALLKASGAVANSDHQLILGVIEQMKDYQQAFTSYPFRTIVKAKVI